MKKIICFLLIACMLFGCVVIAGAEEENECAHQYEVTQVFEPTCTEQGYSRYECTLCGDSYNGDFVEAKGHVSGKTAVENKVDSNCMYRGSYDFVIYCKVCGKESFRKKFSLDRGPHNFKNYVTKATLNKDGLVRSVCSVCKTSELRRIIYRPHSFTFAKTVYNGKVQTPKLVIKDTSGQILTQGTSYKLNYAKGRKNIGKYAVKVTFMGDYSGTKMIYFYIVPKGTSITSTTRVGNGIKVQWKKQTSNTNGYQIQYSQKFQLCQNLNRSREYRVFKNAHRIVGKNCVFCQSAHL